MVRSSVADPPGRTERGPVSLSTVLEGRGLQSDQRQDPQVGEHRDEADDAQLSGAIAERSSRPVALLQT